MLIWHQHYASLCLILIRKQHVIFKFNCRGVKNDAWYLLVANGTEILPHFNRDLSKIAHYFFLRMWTLKDVDFKMDFFLKEFKDAGEKH